MSLYTFIFYTFVLITVCTSMTVPVSVHVSIHVPVFLTKKLYMICDYELRLFGIPVTTTHHDDDHNL